MYLSFSYLQINICFWYRFQNYRITWVGHVKFSPSIDFANGCIANIVKELTNFKRLFYTNFDALGT